MYFNFEFKRPDGELYFKEQLYSRTNKDSITSLISYVMFYFDAFYYKYPNTIKLSRNVYEILSKNNMITFNSNKTQTLKMNIDLIIEEQLIEDIDNKIIFSYKEEKKPEPKPEYSNTYKREFKNVHIQFKYIDKLFEYRTIHTHPADMLDNQLVDIIDTFLNEKPYYKKPNSISISSDLYTHFERRNKITKVGVIEKLFNKYNIISKLDSKKHPYTIMLSYQEQLKASYSIEDSYYNSINNTNKPSVFDSLKKKINQPKTFKELVDYIIHTEYFKNIKNELEKEDPYFKIFGITEKEVYDLLMSKLKELKSDKLIKELDLEISKEEPTKPQITINDVINLQPNPDILIPILKSNILNLDLLNIKSLNLSGKYIHAIKWLCSNFKLTLNVISFNDTYNFINGKLISATHNHNNTFENVYYTYNENNTLSQIRTESFKKIGNVKQYLCDDYVNYHYDINNRLFQITKNNIPSFYFSYKKFYNTLISKKTSAQDKLISTTFLDENTNNIMVYDNNIKNYSFFYSNSNKLKMLLISNSKNNDIIRSYKYSYNPNNILSSISCYDIINNSISEINFLSDSGIIHSCSFSDYTTNNQNSFIINSFN